MARPIQHANSAKTCCKRGHEFTADNTHTYKGRRVCRLCQAARDTSVACRKRKADYHRKYREANRERLREQKALAYRRDHPEKPKRQRLVSRQETSRRYYEKNVVVIAEQQRKRRRTERGRQYMAEWFTRKYYQDQNFNLAVKVRRRIHMALKSASVGRGSRERTINLLGCSFNELRQHFERQFSDGMTWDKCFSGEIHLDHKRPCASFDLSDPEQLRACFHYTNLQPLWAKDNLAKKDKWAA